MRHRRMKRTLGFKTAHRKAVMRNMVTSLLEHGRIITTVPRAKVLRCLADQMVTLAKDGSLHARRRALSVIKDKMVVKKLFDEWGQKFAARSGGYSRIIKMAQRKGDAANLSVIEMAEESLERQKKKPKVKKSTPSVPSVSQPEAAMPEAKPEVIEKKSEEVSETEATIEATTETKVRNNMQKEMHPADLEQEKKA